MRITKGNKRNLQDFDAAEHDRAGHAQTLAPLALAKHDVLMSICNLETAASKLTGKPSAQAAVQQAMKFLEAALELL